MIMKFSLLKGPMDGYNFPVYSTESCPKNKTEWLQRSFVLNCTKRNGYMCVPNKHITVLMEFCYIVEKVSVPKGKKYASIQKYKFKKFTKINCTEALAFLRVSE